MIWTARTVLAALAFAILATAAIVHSIQHAWSGASPRNERVVSHGLLVPVDGVVAHDLVDTWHAPRSGGRRHQGIDIHAPKGTPVRAAVSGVVARMFLSRRGGITVYQHDDTGAHVYYYAHLNGYAPDLREGMRVEQGGILGYVGSTGNASTAHLHFEIHKARGRRWSGGVAVNPYPLLKEGAAPQGGGDGYAAVD